MTARITDIWDNRPGEDDYSEITSITDDLVIITANEEEHPLSYYLDYMERNPDYYIFAVSVTKDIVETHAYFEVGKNRHEEYYKLNTYEELIALVTDEILNDKDVMDFINSR